MKRDELRELGLTEEQLDAVMGINGADINAANAKARSIQAKLDEANGLIDQFQEKQKAAMTAEEQIKKLQEDLASQQRQMAIKENTIDARAILKGIGLPDESVEVQLARIVTEDADATKANAQALADLITAQREATEAATRKSLLQQMPTPAGSRSDGEQKLTKEQFDQMGYLERLSLKQESPETYNELLNS